MTPMPLPQGSRRRAVCWTNSIAYGLWATVSASGDFPGVLAHGKVAIPWSRWTQKKIFAAVEDAAIWKASWDIARCGCASWIWSPKKYLQTQKLATRVAWNLSPAVIARWPPPPPLAFTWRDQGRSTSPDRTSIGLM